MTDCGNRNAGTRNVSLACDILRQRFGDRFLTGKSIREQHAHTTTYLTNQPPDAVVMAESTEDVSWIVNVCAEHRCPVVPFGAGSSLEGQLNAPAGGISIDMAKLDSIIKVDQDDLTVTVQPGVKRIALNEYLRDTGLFSLLIPVLMPVLVVWHRHVLRGLMQCVTAL